MAEMRACYLQYILLFLNFLVYGVFTLYQLCRSKENSYEWRIQLLIIAPFFAMTVTVCLALYSLVTKSSIQCIYFGSELAMYTMDIED